MSSSFDYDLGFDPFNYVTVLLYVAVLFILYILTIQILILIFIILE